MKGPEGFSLEKCLRACERNEYFCAQEQATGRQLLLKRYLGSEPMARARREFERLRKGSGPGLLAAIELDTSDPEPILVLEHFDGELLSERALTSLPIEAWLLIASQLASTLRHIHARHWLHRDLHPANVLLSADTTETRILDLEVAIDYGAGRSDTRVGEAAYTAPEQFGRMGRGVDFRSDLYSLGATLYFALTGRPPFAGTDPLDLMHAHMAQRPTPADQIRRDVPAALSRMLQKLLDKEPDERYQSAQALHADLLECQRLWSEQGAVPDDLVLGASDAEGRPLFSRSQLFGRETEITALAEGLERVRAGGAELWWLRGPPGVGKSVLIEELRRRALREGWLAQGKFDLYRRDDPYSGFAAAFESLAQQILVRGDGEIRDWSERLEASLGANRAVLVEWIPDWRFIVGDLPPAPRLDPRETQLRLARTAIRFLQAGARPAAPLIVFLDDLQWADAGSRFLLAEIAREPSLAGLLLVGTYRDGEVDSVHPLHALLAEIEKGPTAVHAVTLGPLAPEATLSMLADALEKAPSDAAPLAELVLTKTENNPFLVQQFINHMRSLGHLTFRLPDGWTWDLEAIAAADIPDDAVEMVAARIERLQPHAREVLVFASFIGDEFDAELLSELANRDMDAVETALCALSESGLIAPCRAGFRFVHDRIREAAQSLRNDSERIRLHYNTATLLLARTPASELRGRAADLANHFNRALSLVPAETCGTVVQLSVWAAERAVESGAAMTARSYVDQVHALTARDDAVLDPALRFELDFLRAQTRLVSGDYAETEQIARSLAEMDLGPIAFSRAATLRIELYAFMARENEDYKNQDIQTAMEIGVLALRRLRAPYPGNPGRLRAVFEILRTYVAIRGLTAENFVRESGAPDERQEAIIRLEAAMGSIYPLRPYRALVSNACRLRRFREGYTAGFLPASLIGPAMLLLSLGRRASAERIAILCVELLGRGCQSVRGSAVAACVHFLLFGWMRPMRECARETQRLSYATLEEGDLLSLSSCAALWAQAELQGAASLSEVLQACRATQDFSRRSHDAGMLRVFEDAEAILACLGSPDVPSADAAPFSAQRRPMTEAFRGFYWLVMGDPERTHACLKDISSMYGVPDRLPFQRALACASLLRAPASTQGKRGIRRCLRRDHRELRKRARVCPENFLHQRLLVDAERARLRRRHGAALEIGMKAAQRARDAGYPIDAALALERVADLLFHLRRDRDAIQRIREALDLYALWGATAKVAQLREAHGKGLQVFSR